mgnify:CR=1 FL=1
MLQMVLYAPMAILFLRIIGNRPDTGEVAYSLVATSVAAFLGIPLGAAIVTRFALRKLLGPDWYSGPAGRVRLPLLRDAELHRREQQLRAGDCGGRGHVWCG